MLINDRLKLAAMDPNNVAIDDLKSMARELLARRGKLSEGREMEKCFICGKEWANTKKPTTRLRETPMPSEVEKQLKDWNACQEGYDWAVSTCKTMATVWEKCQRGDWMVWLLCKDGTWTQQDKVRISVACAEHVLPLWERRSPKDDRPRKAIEATRAWADDPTDVRWVFLTPTGRTPETASSPEARGAWRTVSYRQVEQALEAALTSARGTSLGRTSERAAVPGDPQGTPQPLSDKGEPFGRTIRRRAAAVLPAASR